MNVLRSVGVAVLVAGGFLGSAEEVKAQGVHFGVGRVHVDVGNPHGRWNGGNYRTAYYGSPTIYRQAYSHGRWGGGHHWHDTSHYDYHPGGFERHGNHFHYVPGHWDYHQTGHWHHDHH